MVSMEPGSQQTLQIGCYVIFAVAMIVVGLRLYCRQFLVGKLGADDYAIIAATLASVGNTVTVPNMYELGIGRHVNDLTQHEFLYSRKWAWVSQILYYLALGLVKTSMVFLYLRLASDKRHVLFLYGFGGVVFLHGIVATIVTIFICTPVSGMWSPSFPEGCIDLLAFNYFNAAFHIFTDIMLAVLPIPILSSLQITHRRKVGLIFAFGVGGLTICVTIARQVTNAIALTQYDYSWYWSAAELCTCLEINMGLICASVPAMRSLIKTFAGSSSDDPSRSYELRYSAKKSGDMWKKRGAYGDGTGSDFNKLASSGAQTRTNIFSGMGHSSRRGSSGSEAEIIGKQHQDGVLQTTDFQVSYSTPSPGADDQSTVSRNEPR